MKDSKFFVSRGRLHYNLDIHSSYGDFSITIPIDLANSPSSYRSNITQAVTGLIIEAELHKGIREGQTICIQSIVNGYIDVLHHIAKRYEYYKND